jgi:hypothetical protein
MSGRAFAQKVIDAKYAHFGEAGTYQVWDSNLQVLGPATDVTVVPTTRDQVADLGTIEVRQAETWFAFRASEVAAPKKDDAVTETATGITYLIDTADRRDRYGLEWIVAVTK